MNYIIIFFLELVNGLRVRKGMSSVGTSEDGEESSSVQDDEDDATLIADLLSNIKAPQVSKHKYHYRSIIVW